jgi:hypothetical protein
MFLFRLFERAVDPVAPPGSRAARWLGAPVPETPPPRRLLGFYWHFARQARALFGLLFATGLTVALLDLLIPVFIGRVVGLLEVHGPSASGPPPAGPWPRWPRCCCSPGPPPSCARTWSPSRASSPASPR